MSLTQAVNNLKLLRQKLSQPSILDFAGFYFPHYMTSQSCSFHKEICDYLMDISGKRNGRLAIAAPRGHAKSTVASFFYVMWSICYNKERFIIILSATAQQAQALLSDITRALETNTRLLEDFSDEFGDGNVKTKSTQHEIITKNNIKVAAFGWDQNFRGIRHHQNRPTLIILDDVDSEKNTYNAKSREKLFNTFTRTILKGGAVKGFNMVAIGTLLHPDSLLSKLVKQEEFPDCKKMIYKAVITFSEHKDLWQTWGNILFARGDLYEEEYGLKAADKFFEAHKQEMLEGTKVLWPEVEDYYKLMKIREIEGAYSFDCEKQNDPTNAQDSRYDPDKFTYWDKDYSNVDQLIASFGNDYSIIGACDPSVGVANNRSDYSAIIILAKHKGHLYILDADIKQRPQDDLVQAIINFCKIYKHMEKFVIEANLFPELLLKTVKERAYKENVIAPLKEIRNTKNKELRIFGMETYITTGTIMFSRKHRVLLDQLKYFPRGDHDDGPDALEMALREAELSQVGFVPLDEDIRDRHGRGIDHPDFERTTPEEDTKDEDDEEGGTTGFVSLD